MTSTNPIVETLKEDVLNTVTLNLCHGTIPLDPKFGTLFYKTEQSSEAKYINFAKGSLKDEDIQMLAKASEKATFGRNKEDVLDETYRKAWKMDTTQFSTQFDVVRSGILDIVHDQLLHYENNTKKLEADLFKLNVYGPGSFFKPHVDTPRSDKLFATLVIVLPTIHKGGNLLLGEEGNLLNFDSASKVYYPKSKEPRIAFVSFYSDIPHEVLPVESGYRITLTYNLYLKEFWQGPLTLKSSSTDTYSSLLASFAKALASPTVLPKGGALGFGLLYRYPINPDTTNLAAFTGALKGNDALIRAVCKALALEPSVQVLYSRGYRNSDKYLTNRIVDGDHFCELAEPYDQPPSRKLWRDAGGKLVLRAENPAPSSFKVPVLWVTEPSEMLTTHLAYATYGNEASLECVYGDLVLVAKVPPYRERVEHLKANHAEVLPENTLKDMEKASKELPEDESPVVGVKRKRPDEDSQELGETDEEEVRAVSACSASTSSSIETTMSSATATVLVTNELLGLIFRHISPAPWDELEDPTGNRPTWPQAMEGPRKDLYSLALCCKAFTEPALRCLWAGLNSLVPLIKLLPDLELIEGEYYFHGTIESDSRFCHVSNYIRLLDISVRDGLQEEELRPSVSPQVFAVICRQLQGEQMLMFLNKLYIYVPPNAESSDYKELSALPAITIPLNRRNHATLEIGIGKSTLLLEILPSAYCTRGQVCQVLEDC
ncbi:hypothetical protein NMY22_g18978 [Coprinellus aureogranulatus]|nr:hypothetical protein NMY22_g18978 [Coprinellus aureogranulatus]